MVDYSGTVERKYVNIQGHRGARGLFPENTIIGFIEALKSGVRTLELDVVISADKQVVVSHEAWMNEAFCSLPNGSPVLAANARNYNLYRMRYAEIKQFDCGCRGNKEFPLQRAMPAHKPLLRDVFASVEQYSRDNNIQQVSYNIELKTEGDDGLYNPPPHAFAGIVYDEIKQHAGRQPIHIQSFDVRLLKEIRRVDPTLQVGLLVENGDGLDANLERLGFMPVTYSPEFILVDNALVRGVHERGMKLIPWTVNEQADINNMLAMGVDGIITDYPDRLIKQLT